uniref:Mediator of RNA polymerase II transcription subunit 24 n=1 Tax=Panagrellus redivivus TaxID=6233 RepID=A0A7E4W937_PANRE
MTPQKSINTVTELLKSLQFDTDNTFDIELNNVALSDNFHDYTNPKAVRNLCEKQMEILDKMQNDYTSALERYKYCVVTFDFLEWLLRAMKYLLGFNSFSVDYQESVGIMLETVKKLADNRLYSLFIYTYIHNGQRIVDLDKLRRKAQYIADGCERKLMDGPAKELAAKLEDIVEDLIDGPKATVYRPSPSTLPESHPGVLTLGSIFASVNAMDSDYEAAQTILTFSHTVGISRSEMLFDLLRVGPLMQLKEDQVGRRALADVFAFLRVPNLIRIFMVKFNVEKNDILAAIRRFVGLTSILNNLDTSNACDFVENLVRELVRWKVLTEAEADEIYRERVAAGGLPLKYASNVKSQLAKIQRAEKIATLMVSLNKEDDNNFIAVANKYLITTDGTSERVFASLAATGDLREVSVRLAKINFKAQTCVPDAPKLNDSRILAFDISFLLLAKIKYMFGDVRLTLSDPELELESKFITWWDAYESALIKQRSMSPVGDCKKDCAKFYQMLQGRAPFWSETDDLRTILDLIPGLGEQLMEDNIKNSFPSDNKLENCLQPFRNAPFLLVCLVQWLETLPKAPIHLIRDISATIKHFAKSSGKHLSYAAALLEPALEHLLKNKHKEYYYTWVVTNARRTLPTVRYMELPDDQMLKEAYIYANHQGWASPDVIALIANCTRTGYHQKFTTCWIQQVTKSLCADEVLAATELILAIAFISPTPVLAELNQNLLEKILPKQHNTPVNQSTCRAVAWMLVRIMLLLIYTEGVRRDKALIKQTIKDTGARKRHAPAIDQTDDLESEDVAEPMPKRPKTEETPEVEPKPEPSSEPPAKRRKTAPTPLLMPAPNPEVAAQQECAAAIEEHLFNDDPDEGPSLELDPQPYPEGDRWPFPAKSYPLCLCDYDNAGFVVENNKLVVSNTLVLTMMRFGKQLKVPSLRPSLTFIAHFLQQLSRVPRSRFSHRFNTVLLDPQYIFSLIRTEPFAISLDEMLRLYDVRDPEQLEHILYFACMIRRFDAI